MLGLKIHDNADFGAEIIRAVREGDGLSRVELARVLGVAASTIGRHVDSLVDAGYFTETLETSQSAGRPPTRLRPNPARGCFLGVDFNATDLFATVVDFAQNTIKQIRRPLDEARSVPLIVEHLSKAIKDLAAEAGLPVLSVGIAAPGRVDNRKGIALHYAHVPGFENVKSLNDLVAMAKARPNEISYAILGMGSTGHLTMEWISSLAGIKLQPVAYKGGAPATADVLGGHVPLLFADSTVIAPHVKAGKLRPIAVNFGKRMPGFPDVPTVIEQGFTEVNALPWVVLAGPPNMSAADAKRVADAVQRVYARPELIRALQAQNIEPKSSSPKEATELMERDLAVWKKIIQQKGIKGS